MRRFGSWFALGLGGLLGLAGCVEGALGEEVTDIVLPSDDKADGFDDVDPASCPDGAPRLVDGGPAAWTLIHYAAADNNLESVIVDDVNEMELGHQGSPNVNVLVQLDRYSERGVWRYEVEPDRDMQAIGSRLVGQSEEEPDSGDWRTLASFGRWAATCYPAEAYMVVIGGHGSGWSESGDGRAPSLGDRARARLASRHGESLRHIAPDDTNGSRIHVDELAQALRAIREVTRRPDDPEWLNRVVAYGSDACLMETIEVAYDLRNTVTYLVGSEETEPGPGWPYSTITRELTTRPVYYALRPEDLMAQIVDAYGRSYAPGGVENTTGRTTMAVVDTGAIIRARNRVSRIAELLSALMAQEERLAPTIRDARSGSHNFGDGYTDLGLFLSRLRSELIQDGLIPEVGRRWDGDERWRELREEIDDLSAEVWADLVPAARVSGEYEGARGLSIFMPRDNCGYGLDLDGYALSTFAEDTAWDELVDALNNSSTLADLLQQSNGEGSMNARSDRFGSFEGIQAGCELRAGVLYVYSRQYSCVTDPSSGECRYPPDLSFDIQPSEEQLTVTAAHVWHRQSATESDLRDISIKVGDAEIAAGERYSGSIVLPFETRAGEPAEVTASFVCEDFEIRNCVDYYDDWW